MRGGPPRVNGMTGAEPPAGRLRAAGCPPARRELLRLNATSFAAERSEAAKFFPDVRGCVAEIEMEGGMDVQKNWEAAARRESTFDGERAERRSPLPPSCPPCISARDEGTCTTPGCGGRVGGVQGGREGGRGLRSRGGACREAHEGRGRPDEASEASGGGERPPLQKGGWKARQRFEGGTRGPRRAERKA